MNAPDVVTNATKDYQAEEDIIGHFIDDCCILGRTIEAKAGEVYKAYRQWAEENGHKQMSGTRFGKEMKTRFDSYKSG